MHAVFRLVSMLLALTLAGGAQACMALCTTPAKVAQTAAIPQRATCHHCGDKSPAKPTSDPTGPCKHCPTASQDRVATESDHTILKTAVEFHFLAHIDLAIVAPTLDHPVTVAPDRVHSPPSDLLHQFCLLLI
jgi:hypothetical protein